MKQIKQGLVPKLRFREFVGDGDWEKKKLRDVTSAIFDGTHQTPTYTSKGIPFYSVENLISRNKNKFISHEDYLIATSKNKPSRGDILLTRIGKIGYSKVVTWDFEFSVYVTLAVIKKSESFNSLYLHFFMQSERYQNEIFKKSLLNAVPCKINMDSLRDTRVLLPKITEQQKIADCLSSLDELIEAEDQKLEALQRHKKGLMQELFPADGETLPRLRFPEFQSAPEWEEKPFSNFIKLYRGSSPRPIQEFLTKNNDGVNWIKIGDTKFSSNFIIGKVEEKITKKGAERSRFVEIGELILANSMSYGKTYQLAINGCIYDGWFVLREYEDFFYKPFLLQLLNSDFMQKQYESLSAGGIVQNISSEVVYSSKLFHTSIPEQARIADFLTSVDDLITSQTKKLESLRLHKKGLMQQLFPNHNQEEIINQNKP